MNHRVSSLRLFVTLALAVAVIAPMPARACVRRPIPKPLFWVIFHSPTTAWIGFHGYTTFGTSAGQFCACGFSPLSGGVITSVDAVLVVDRDTQTPIAGFNFSVDAAVSASLQAELPTGNWTGLISDQDAAVAADLNIDILLEVTVVDGSTATEIVAELGGMEVALGTAEADAIGALLPGHLAIIEGPFNAVPAVTEWGMAAMVLLLLVTGTIVFRRYSAKKSLA